ncbi:MAG TPA: hypothetical protein PLW02_03700 [Verrucomicrobiota bacterium]|nr:hypothetical protein [Verrucomicrobiota bacterium]
MSGREVVPANKHFIKKTLLKLTKTPSGKSTVLLKILLIIGAPLTFLLFVEIILRLFNYGYSIEFFSRYEDKYLIPNTNFARRFFPAGTVKTAWPFKIPIEKPQGTTRIFVLGDSAAQGTPAPAFGFARILELMLERQFPSNKFEVINAAMRGINSYVVIPIAEECAKYGADGFVIYLGNNETVGLYAPEPDKINIVEYPILINLKHLASQTKIYQLIGDIILKINSSSKHQTQDFEYFQKYKIAFNNKARIATIKNYESNLRKICKVATKNGAKVFLSTIAVNLQDSPPFGSLHKKGITENELKEFDNFVSEGDLKFTSGDYSAALIPYEKAYKIDNEYAELNYKIAECYKAAGKIDIALKYYQLACDYDALPFRSDSRINNVIRKIAEDMKVRGVFLIDTEQTIIKDALSRNEIPGNHYFHEYAHFKFSGDYLLAKTSFAHLVSNIVRTDPNYLEKLISTIPSEQECALRLAYTLWDELDIEASIVRFTSTPLFQGQLNHSLRQAQAERNHNQRLKSLTNKDIEKALAIYEFALSERPNDWQIHFNYANLLDVIKNYEASIKHYEFVLKEMPIFTQCKALLENEKSSLSQRNIIMPSDRANSGIR